jgi:hypothetical protein
MWNWAWVMSTCSGMKAVARIIQSKGDFFTLSAYHLQNMSLIKNNFNFVMNHKLVIPVNPLLELVMIQTRKVLVTVWIISDLNRHCELELGNAEHGVVVYAVVNG